MLDNWTTAPFSEPVRAMLGFLHKLSHTPDEAKSEDVQPLHAAGVSDDMIIDALHVSLLLHTMNRISNALDFEVFSTEDFARKAETRVQLGGARTATGF